jgi:hypothetical protein
MLCCGAHSSLRSSSGHWSRPRLMVSLFQIVSVYIMLCFDSILYDLTHLLYGPSARHPQILPRIRRTECTTTLSVVSCFSHSHPPVRSCRVRSRSDHHQYINWSVQYDTHSFKLGDLQLGSNRLLVFFKLFLQIVCYLVSLSLPHISTHYLGFTTHYRYYLAIFT